MELITLDLFDTLVSRTYIKPKDLFFDMETSLGESFKGFANERINTEFKLRKSNDFQKEVTLLAIYNSLAKESKIKNINFQSLERLMNLELRYEKNSIYANPEMLHLFNNLKEKKQVKGIIVTDTYFPKEFLFILLRGLRFNVEEDDLFASSVYGEMKSTGRLLDLILKKFDIPPGCCTHVGDNYEHEILKATKLGMNTYHYTNCIPNRYEQTPSSGNIKCSKLAGISRRVRLETPHQINKKESVIWKTTANVTAPILVCFVIWVLQNAISTNVKVLYFCSRDGQILYKIAKKIVSTLNLDIEISYLYVSRQSLLLPSLTELNSSAIDWIMAPTALLTPRIILKRVGINYDEAKKLLQGSIFLNSFDSHLSEEDRKLFANIIINNNQDILEKAKSHRNNVLGYFKQQKVLNQEKFAMVDIGWSGSLQQAISKILDYTGHNIPTLGYYFGLINRKKHKKLDQFYGWFTDYAKGHRELFKKTYIIPMTELFTAADHGGVSHYKHEKDKYKPVLRSKKNINAIDWGLKIQHNSTVRYTEILTSDKTLLDKLFKNQPMSYLERLYELFITSPSYEEAETYGSYLDAEDQNESYYKLMSKPYSKFETILRTLPSHKNLKHHHNEWVEGSLKLSK